MYIYISNIDTIIFFVLFILNLMSFVSTHILKPMILIWNVYPKAK